jgi:hypothetical protein
MAYVAGLCGRYSGFGLMSQRTCRSPESDPPTPKRFRYVVDASTVEAVTTTIFNLSRACNSVQGATASLAFMASLALWNL